MRALTVAMLLLLGAGPVRAAENIDLSGTGEQFAWAENAGWLNAEPGGNGGAGVEVRDFALAGYLWGENVGWVSVSGVRNDGQGQLSGFAWSENAGWIDFGPSNAGVVVDPATGLFGGRAWGENVGWISFDWASGGSRVRTAWTCSPAPPPPATAPSLSAVRLTAGVHLSWSAPSGATAYDVVMGSLDDLRATAGDFTIATDACLAGKTTATSLDLAGLAGGNVWYLVRAANCGGPGTYDSGATQSGSRDPEIAASGAACP
jgi:hypothetical protein